MTPCERLALQSLSRASLGCFSSSKRFIQDVGAKPDDYELSPRQKWNLWRLAWRYRKQLTREVSDMALELWAGANPPESSKKTVIKAVERRTKDAAAREVLKRPIRFGDVELAEAGRRLAKRA